MLRTVTLPIVLPAILAGGLLVFIETLENFGVPFVLAEDMPIFAVEAFKLFVGETAPNPASAGVLGVLLILHDVGAAGPAPLPGAAPFATGARRAPPLLTVGRGCALLGDGLLLDGRGRGAGAVLRHRRAVVHGIPRPGAALRLSLDNFAQLLQRSYRPLVNTLIFDQAAALARP